MSSVPRRVLATDLDGTLIPLEEEPDNQRDLSRLSEALQRNATPLLYVTGRHLASVLEAQTVFRLPAPTSIVCDVGTSLYHRTEHGEWVRDPSYSEQLESRLPARAFEIIARQLAPLGTLTRQEPEKQGTYKLSYYTDARQLPQVRDSLSERLASLDLAYQLILSVDPFNGDGLVDILPPGVHKSFALDTWVAQQGWSRDEVIFAGDSGNDLAALTAGYAAIVVGNADDEVVQQARTAHRAAGWSDRLYCATRPATSGLLEGCQHWGLVEAD